jgi:putative redox protein
MLHATIGETAYRVEIVAGEHRLVADEPPDNGGADAGPGPFELVVSGLAACTLITLRMYAVRKGWTAVTLSGRFGYRRDGDAHRIDRHIEVAGAPDEAALQRMLDIVERTPVTLALKAGFAISTELAAAQTTTQPKEHS